MYYAFRRLIKDRFQIFLLENGVLELPAVKLPHPDSNCGRYGARLRMLEEGMSFTLEEVICLDEYITRIFNYYNLFPLNLRY